MKKSSTEHRKDKSVLPRVDNSWHAPSERGLRILHLALNSVAERPRALSNKETTVELLNTLMHSPCDALTVMEHLQKKSIAPERHSLARIQQLLDELAEKRCASKRLTKSGPFKIAVYRITRNGARFLREHSQT